MEAKVKVREAADIGRVVRDERKRQKLTQVELAGLCRVGPRFIVSSPTPAPSVLERSRSGSPASRLWGEDPAQACRYANVADLSAASALNWTKDPANIFFCTDGFTYTAPVGSFAANAFGLYDMLGNVWQWTGDCWNDTYAGAPSNGLVWSTGDCSRRVARGGSWSYGPTHVRVGFRDRVVTGSRVSFTGFRVARTQ
jgi:sulfatase modifying factor 1